jgi:hypothetical protein
MVSMARVAEKTTANRRNAVPAKPAVSELGRKLRRISDRIMASGEKLLTRRQLERELTERRGGVR